MTDIIRIALERRAQLHEEAMELDAFLRSAESLLKSVEGGAAAAAYAAPRQEAPRQEAPRQEAPRPVAAPRAEEAPRAADADEAGTELERRGIIRRRA